MASRILLATILLTCLSACGVSRPIPAPSLYERLGGKGVLMALVLDWNTRNARDPRLSARLGDVAGTQGHLKTVDVLCQLSAGPCRFSRETLHAVHQALGVTGPEFDALLDNLRQAMVRYRIPEKEQKELLQRLKPLGQDIVSRPG